MARGRRVQPAPAPTGGQRKLWGTPSDPIAPSRPAPSCPHQSRLPFRLILPSCRLCCAHTECIAQMPLHVYSNQVLSCQSCRRVTPEFRFQTAVSVWSARFTGWFWGVGSLTCSVCVRHSACGLCATETSTRTHSRTHANTHTDTHASTHARVLTRTHARTHARARAHTGVYAFFKGRRGP